MSTVRGSVKEVQRVVVQCDGVWCSALSQHVVCCACDLVGIVAWFGETHANTHTQVPYFRDLMSPCTMS